MESSGGRNVWGRDRVESGGIYTPGSEVDRDTYLRYREARKAGQVKTQGVGPTQLTFWKFQDQADEIGGCHDPAVNCRVGFGIMAGYLRNGSVRDAMTQYNKGTPGESPYATRALPLVARWREVLSRL